MPKSSPAAMALLFSGGLDSAILLGTLLRQGQVVHPLYVDSGLHWQPAELTASRRFLAALGGPRLPALTVFELPLGDVYGDHWSLAGRGVPDEHTPDEAVYLPGRNLLLAVKPAIWCRRQGLERLALGVLASNPFADATDEFFRGLTATLEQGLSGRLEIVRPFAHLHKQEVMALGRDLPLELTFSCIDPQGPRHCGRCNKCGERRAAFAAAGLADRTDYARAPRGAGTPLGAVSGNGRPAT